MNGLRGACYLAYCPKSVYFNRVWDGWRILSEDAEGVYLWRPKGEA